MRDKTQSKSIVCLRSINKIRPLHGVFGIVSRGERMSVGGSAAVTEAMMTASSLRDWARAPAPRQLERQSQEFRAAAGSMTIE